MKTAARAKFCRLLAGGLFGDHRHVESQLRTAGKGRADGKTARWHGAGIGGCVDSHGITSEACPLRTAPVGRDVANAPDRKEGGRWVCIWVRHGIEAHHMPIGGEKERCAGVLIGVETGPHFLVIGTVLPWRGDKRRAHYRGAAAFTKALETQSRAWQRAMHRSSAAGYVIAGDWNQELDQDGPVGTQSGRKAMTGALKELELPWVTSGARDPLRLANA